MTRIRFEDLPSTNTPRNAENLNKLNNVVISPTEPTTGEEVWIQKGKNLLNTPYTESNKVTITALSNDYFVDTQYSCYLEAGKTYTMSFESDCNDNSVEMYIGKDYTLNQYFRCDGTTKKKTFTVAASGTYYLRYDVNVSGATHSFWNFQIEHGNEKTSYEPYIDKKIYTKNDNGVYEEFYSEESVFEIKTGTGSPIPEYISGAENNHYEKVGKVVSYSFTMTVTGSWGTTTKFIRRLPRPKTNVRFLAIDTTNSDKILRCSLNTNGEISNAYSASAPTEGHIIEGYITYITTD